jgi:hypothetical protein
MHTLSRLVSYIMRSEHCTHPDTLPSTLCHIGQLRKCVDRDATRTPRLKSCCIELRFESDW